ncbi:MAG: plasmid pRiA4b ORF-3 family protein [Candidatus Sericytochromatia bacterium]
MYAPFALLFPEESDRQRLNFRMPRRNAYQLPAGQYELYDIYPALQEPPVYEIFLNVTNAQADVLATLYCQLDAEAHAIHLSLSEVHLQQQLAPALLAAIESHFNAARGQHWAELLLLRATRMQQALQQQQEDSDSQSLGVPAGSGPPVGRDLRLLREEALHMLMQHNDDPEQQESLIDALLGEMRQLMLSELESYRREHQLGQDNKIILFPGKRIDPWEKAHWLDLRVELLDLPEIWRSLRVPDALSLTQFHRVLQLAMGWQDSHLWRFVHTKGEYMSHSQMENMWDEELDADTVTLHELLTRKGSRLDYEYDFGDSWYHVIKVETRHRPDSLEQPTMGCSDGARACPPEDAGGYLGYQHLLKTLAKKRKTQADRELLQQLGPYDPAHFDVSAVDRALQALSAELR